MKCFIFVIFILMAGLVQAEEHTIDKFERECIKKNLSTAGMANCTYEARMQWDQEMNKYYQLLQKILTKDQSSVLRDAQRKWIAFREAEFENIDAMFGTLQGTMYINIAGANRREIVKQRAIDLKSFYGVLSLSSQ